MTTRTEPHQHHWQVASTHQVSDGLVVYRKCACGQWQISTTPAEPVAMVAPRNHLRIIDA